ncbi:acyl carrier protein [Amycolatopsis bartoniae]|uniref:Carrier domain-containing protein n=1 Tax=Amycolatopsis bartoniae TaxID=941986 RepID=A0A8H9IQY3_9PSEU|nr:acyl carrier protein [Amycolatopsis bartoniae]MBB2934280.1 acyl carrier protein [Amycolatopsis bartoniae]TVT08479.1 acyl carrier protein [Amycolatopsis bartoniae]GHF48537.1 hypothetical protein GCM10017566_22320 [Amycolatopsis bartoniae]
MIPSSVEAELFDCLQVNLAALAVRHHGDTAAHLLGSELVFRPKTGRGILPTVEPSLDEQLAAARRKLGLRVVDSAENPPVRNLLADDGPVFVVTDAYHLPWVPYHHCHHVEHSFLLEPSSAGACISDAYHNDTQWGSARPCQLEYSRPALAALIDDLPRYVVVRFEPERLGPMPLPSVELDRDEVETYIASYCRFSDRKAALQRFSLEVWLLLRARRLYMRYLVERNTTVARAAREQLDRWADVVARVYLSYRRVYRDRPELPGIFPLVQNVLNEDFAAFSPRASVEDDGGIRATVRETVASVLGVDGPLVESGALTDLATFSSLRMVEIVERLESVFSVEFPPGSLLPEKLTHVSDLCELVRATRPWSG